MLGTVKEKLYLQTARFHRPCCRPPSLALPFEALPAWPDRKTAFGKRRNRTMAVPRRRVFLHLQKAAPSPRDSRLPHRQQFALFEHALAVFHRQLVGERQQVRHHYYMQNQVRVKKTVISKMTSNNYPINQQQHQQQIPYLSIIIMPIQIRMLIHFMIQ